MNEDSISRIRDASFPTSRLGYDKKAVKAWLNRMADWLEASMPEEQVLANGNGAQHRSVLDAADAAAKLDQAVAEFERARTEATAIVAAARREAESIEADADQRRDELVDELLDFLVEDDPPGKVEKSPS